MKSIFKFKDGAHLKGDAQPVGERLEALRLKRAGLTPESVLKDATNEASPLHPFFDWDDARAAKRFRLDQAGHLIRCVTVVIEDAPERQAGLPAVDAPGSRAVTVRAFLPVHRPSGERIYESTARALGDVEYRRQVLKQAHSELDAVGRKYRELQELSEVVQAIDRVGELLAVETATPQE